MKNSAMGGPQQSAAMLDAPGRLAPYVLLAALAAAMYSSALWFAPTIADELRYLTSVAATPNPLIYFIHDHGHGNFLYRPLTSVSIWLLYRLFGAWDFPNQALDLLLHLVSACLVFRIVRRVQPDRAIAFLCAAVFLVSRYTLLTATSTPDRPMALTGLFLLLLVNDLAESSHAAAPPLRLWRVAAYALLALLSKESGLVVPAVGIGFFVLPGLSAHLPRRERALAIGVLAAIIAGYFVLRFALFGPQGASYDQDGYLFFGLRHYDKVSSLPGLLPYVAFAENVFKNLVAPVAPIFGEGGNLLTRGALLGYLPVIVPTALLFALTLTRRPTRLQWIAILIIAANAVVHFALFRFRLQYMSHAALCLFVGAAPRGPGGARNTAAIRALGALLLLAGVVWAGYVLNLNAIERVTLLDGLARNPAALPSGVDRHVVEQVLAIYYK